ncbi:hypothetical protein ACIF8T_01400 [Streptomyces sp. NPDC085946]|uniref:hypothetical protein n=1 Tax=Streptomyces sp. NPDC085946 TaxID=3365744 RepID=UPI0037D11E35
MRHINGRAVRTAIGTAAATAALALPLVLGGGQAAAADDTLVLQAGQDVTVVGTDPEVPEEPVFPKPKDPGEGKGSWVWDKEKP